MNIGSVVINSPVMNGACSVAKSIDDVKALCKTKVVVVLVGSITVEPRDGNPEPRWYTTNKFSLNSFGMPNKGMKFYDTELPKMTKHVHSAGKKFALSIAGFSTKEYVALAKMANKTGVDLLELNFGCPNVSINGNQKPIVSFDPNSIKEIIDEVSKVTNISLMIKLSPYSNPAELNKVANVINNTNRVAAVVTSNTFPNGFISSNGQPVIANTYGGVSGSAMLPIAIGQVRQFKNALLPHVKVIGVGGIETSEDAKQYFEAGADMVQCATLIVRDGHAAIDRVIS